MSKNGVPSLTANSRKKAKEKKNVVSDGYGLEIIVNIGDTMRNKGIVKKTDVLTKSENKGRRKAVKLRELVDYGYVVEVEEESHQHQVRHYDLTSDGWAIWSAVEETSRHELPTKISKRIWSDSEQQYIEVE